MRRLRWWIGLVASLAPMGGIPAAALDVSACEQTASTMLVQVQGVRSGQGTLVAELYGDNSEAFLRKAGRLIRERVPARPGSMALCLPAPRPGVYAVAVYHDENDNRKFDRSWIGLPSEGYGVSNNPRPLFRAPTHSESAIRVGTGHRVVNIELRY
ncbi:MAG TPA: DUF2141 domain-containing protein [Methylomirabilota bacterium]|nr:DUF2141 domain-containing protein [Methylomirabilota bacterium]